MSKRCWLFDGCPSRTGVCYSCEPDGDDCPIWRWFKDQMIVKCKNCKHGEKVNSVYLCCKPRGFGAAHEPDWFCADGKRKEVK